MAAARSPSFCPGPLDRRSWLTVGGLSLGALVTGPGPTLAGLFAAEAAAPGRALSKDFSVILFWANGGPSHIDTFDLKPDAPAEARGPFRPIRTNVTGMHITERLPRLAKRADKFAIVRSLHHTRAEHSGGSHRFLTGHASVAANLNDSEFPDLGSIVAKQLEGRRRDVPVFVADTKPYGSGPAYLGPAYAPFMHSPNPLSSTGNNTYDPVPLYLTERGRAGLLVSRDGAVTLRRREGLRQALDALPRQLDRDDRRAAFDRFQRRAVDLLAGRRTREAFDLSREDHRTRERYGETHWGKSLLTARRLVEAGVRFVQCQAGFRLSGPVGRITTWDDHSVNADVFKAYDERTPCFDQAVSALIDDLYQRGLDKHVLFVFCGEFGRTPRIERQDASGRPGRDHWPRAMSVLLAGGGLKMGQTVGRSSARGEIPVTRPFGARDLLATLYHVLGIDPKFHLPGEGRPLPILADGSPIAELV